MLVSVELSLNVNLSTNEKKFVCRAIVGGTLDDVVVAVGVALVAFDDDDKGCFFCLLLLTPRTPKCPEKPKWFSRRHIQPFAGPAPASFRPVHYYHLLRPGQVSLQTQNGKSPKGS
jgi:hypothetical protein